MVQIRYHDLDKLVDLGMNQISRNLSVTEMPVISICVLKVNDCFLMSVGTGSPAIWTFESQENSIRKCPIILNINI